MTEANDGIRDRHSGYQGTIDDWRRFLSCWYRQWRSESENPQWDVQFQLIKKDVLADGVDLERTEASYRARIEARERFLNSRLPRSYVDFLLAYQPEEWYRVDGDGAHSSTRMVSVDALDFVGSVHPGYVASVEAASEGMTTPDDEYYIYGSNQDLVSTRPKYLRQSLLVGYHDFESSQMIVMHPQVLTADGEMEGEKYTFASSFRATNFAELMRQIYRLTVLHWPLPRDEREMRATCAGLLPVDAWWERGGSLDAPDDHR